MDDGTKLTNNKNLKEQLARAMTNSDIPHHRDPWPWGKRVGRDGYCGQARAVAPKVALLATSLT